MPASEVRFEEAIDHLKQRLAMPPGAWLKLVQEMDAAARDRAAGMSDALVADILRAALKALEDGTGLAEFFAAWDELTKRHGWSDDSGGRRAALTFRVLTAQAYAAGRWKQIQRLKSVRPYLRYVHVDPDLTQPGSRHEHANWHGTVLPVDDPWWNSHFPPNGFSCRCYVQSLSERDLARYGYQVSEEAPDSPTVILWVRGRLVETPKGIDPGFAFILDVT
jgi:SPP1 gp7 family putative phage head morphogenesis protein